MNNMLGVKKVRMHGMHDSRWTTRDKITQYKGLINLFTRDRKIIEVDTNVARKKQVKELKQLRKLIIESRKQMDNCIHGDRQLLRNTLSEHKDMQLAYQDLHPLDVAHHLDQNIFNKRKCRDRLNYTLKLKKQKLIDLKLEKAELEDSLHFTTTYMTKLPVEAQSHLVTGKVQDAILRKEAAFAVKHSYNKILDILKKDALYFDAVLSTIYSEAYSQSKCMIRTVELGQLATEYLDDRKDEYAELEKAVKRDLKERLKSLKLVQDQEEEMSQNMRFLIRRDSDINLAKVFIPRSESEICLIGDIENIEEILTFLKHVTAVSKYECIYPCLEEQRRQKERLHDFIEIKKTNRDNLLKKTNHADLMHAELVNTICPTMFEYKTEKKRLLDEIQVQLDRKARANKVYLSLSNLMVQIRSSLHQLQLVAKIIKSPSERKSAVIEEDKHHSSSDSMVVKPEFFEPDGEKIASLLVPKLNTLVNKAGGVILTDEKHDDAYKQFLKLVHDTCLFLTVKETVLDEALVDVVVEDAHVPTRLDIKAASQEIYEVNTVNPNIPVEPKKGQKK